MRMRQPKTGNRIRLTGICHPEVLGTFAVIRGFADLRDLAAISVPFTMSPPDAHGRVQGHQREIDEVHAEDIQRYFENSSTRFIPEVILSLRMEHEARYDDRGAFLTFLGKYKGISLGRRRSELHQIYIDRSELPAIREDALIRRIDGNHRLALAENLAPDETLPSKYIAPFCMILLGPEDDHPEDDYAESVIFHTVNSTAMPLDSEHALSLILGQNSRFSGSAQQEFEQSPELYMTRRLRDKLNGLPTRLRNRLGDKPLTLLSQTAKSLLELQPGLRDSRQKLVLQRHLFIGHRVCKSSTGRR